MVRPPNAVSERKASTKGYNLLIVTPGFSFTVWVYLIVADWPERPKTFWTRQVLPASQ